MIIILLTLSIIMILFLMNFYCFTDIFLMIILFNDLFL